MTPSHRCLGCGSPIDETFRACPRCGDVITDFARRYATDLLDGKYQIVERLGAGGMGEVYRAQHTYLGSTRVIKVVRAQISESADAHERFLREARAATKVQHPNVAMLHDFSALPDGSHYMVWEYIEGENLAQRLRSVGTLPPRQALRVAIQALQGLEAIHRAGIIHRDISPENLMITRDDETVKIIDLGVAKLDDPTETASTQTGIFVGKLRYASPEQLGFLPAGERVDARADIYALGMVLYEMLVGRPPYEAKSPHEYFLLHAREAGNETALLPAELPAASVLQSLLDRALARDRNARFSRAGEFAAALQEVDRMIAAGQMSATVTVSLEGDETLKQVPGSFPPYAAAPTIRTGFSAPVRSSHQRLRLFAIAMVVVITLAVGGYFMWPRSADLPPQPVLETQVLNVALPSPGTQLAQSPPVTQSPRLPELSGTELTVAAPTADEPEPQPVSAPEKRAAPTSEPRRKAPAEPIEEKPGKEPVGVTVTATPPSSPAGEKRPATSEVPLYVDGGGDANTNRSTILSLRNEVKDIRQVAVEAGTMRDQFVRSLKDHMPHLEIVDSAPVVIHFEGTLERLGMGRKRREGHGTVTRDGRVIFRYELPNEVFRVGMTPPDAFARILSDAFLE